MLDRPVGGWMDGERTSWWVEGWTIGGERLHGEWIDGYRYEQVGGD